ncbi:MAG: hypothetical protein V1916_00480, partial [Patescibacteria group bacterium]
LPHQAAVDLYKAVDLANSQYTQLDRQELHRFFNDPADFDEMQRHLRSQDIEYDIRYARNERGNIVKTYKTYGYYESYGTTVPREDLVNRDDETVEIAVGSRGLPAQPNGRRMNLDTSIFNYDEFIRGAAPVPAKPAAAA